MIGAGRRSRRITIQSLAKTTTDAGEVTEVAATLATVWAAIEPLNGSEQWLAKQSQAITTHKITMLYRDDVTSDMQALYNGRTFRFESVINIDEANRHLLIMATEVL